LHRSLPVQRHLVIVVPQELVVYFDQEPRNQTLDGEEPRLGDEWKEEVSEATGEMPLMCRVVRQGD
jgi:hypothetical protein